ncbi:MAG: addiction module protein [Syntrophales bacterium]
MMNVDLKRIEKEVFSLSSQERARLAMNLIKSLDNHDDADVEELWLQEAERRYREYREGKLQTRSADDVFRDAFSKVR